VSDLLDSLIERFGDDPAVTLGILGVLAFGMAAIALAGLRRDRRDLRRRAAEGIEARPLATRPKQGNHSLDRVMTTLQTQLSAQDNGEARLLRMQLIQAGFFDQRAVAVYFAARGVCALALGAGLVILLPWVSGGTGTQLWLWSALGGMVGYLVPSFALKRRIAGRVQQHRTGFPDFMDLMVVCAEAGLSLEAAVERISREISEGYPSLAQNLAIVSLEMRAGKPFGEALERFGRRVVIEEAGMLATLLQQSSELGTSLSQSLRVYSEEMRHKRLSRAEEKAYALPSKLVVPLMLFIFPVLIMTLMLPVAVRMSSAGFGG
jgi:tight adherence protein C